RDARARRDALFDEVRSTGDASGEAGEALGGAIVAADAVADALRAEAKRVAEKKALEMEARDLERRRVELDARREALEARERASSDALRVTCAAITDAISSAQELRGFVRRIDQAREVAKRVSEAEDALALLDREGARHTARLRAVLEGTSSDEDILGLIARADRALRAARAEEAEQRAISKSKADLEEERARLIASLASKEEELESFLDAWRAGVAAIGLPASATVEEAQAHLDLLSGLDSDSSRARELRRSLAVSASEELAIERLSEELVVHHAPDLVGLDLERKIPELVRRHREARTLHARVSALSEQLEALDSERAAIAAELEEDAHAFRSLLDAAGVPDLGELVVLEEKSESA
ncbi:MAG: hypothetical protein H5U40_04300, partial [Polyangiaceae bacterium]|nr:hypothetical protein [Polyangiaceae bacterium]